MKDFADHRKSSKIQQIEKKYVCLNPKCQIRQKCFSLLSSVQKQKYQSSQHYLCKNWIFSFDKNNLQAQQFKEQTSIDFLKQPIKSIFYVQQYAKRQWQKALIQQFKNISLNFNKKLDQIFENCIDKITENIEFTCKIANSIREYAKTSIQYSQWTQQLTNIYDNELKNDMMKIKQKGKIHTLNYQAVAKQIQILINQISKFQNHIWSLQKQNARKQRSIVMDQQQLFQNIKIQKNPARVNQHLQTIYSGLKLPGGVNLNQQNLKISVRCPLCKISLPSYSHNKNQMRKQCRQKLLNHMCCKHRQQIYYQLVHKQIKKDIKLTYQQFLFQLSSQENKRYLIIDRQNINFIKFIQNVDRQTYYLQIVASGKQNLPRGKYLLAPSTGKDAADILIVMVLLQISKYDPKAQILLITNDHFGTSLLPIFEQRGIKIKIVNKGNYLSYFPDIKT